MAQGNGLLQVTRALSRFRLEASRNMLAIERFKGTSRIYKPKISETLKSLEVFHDEGKFDVYNYNLNHF